MGENTKKLTDLVAKVQKDAALKKDLLKDPVAFMEKALAIKLPAGTSIKVVEDTDSLLHVVLPLPSGEDKGGNVIKDKTRRKDFVERTYRDAAFKAKLLKSPNATIEKEGVKLPAGLKVVIVEDSARALHLVLPVAGAKDPLGEPLDSLEVPLRTAKPIEPPTLPTAEPPAKPVKPS